MNLHPIGAPNSHYLAWMNNHFCVKLSSLSCVKKKICQQKMVLLSSPLFFIKFNREFVFLFLAVIPSSVQYCVFMQYNPH